MEQGEQSVRDWTAEEILHELDRQRARLRGLGVRSIGLFGSYRHGTATRASDMDFLVTFDHLSFDAYMTVKFFLEDLFGCSVDLVIEEDLKPRLRPSILKEVIYAPGL